MAIRIIVASCQPVVRAGIVSEVLKDASLEVICEATNVYLLLKYTQKYNPDVVIVDTAMADFSFISSVKHLSKLTRVVALSDQNNVMFARKLLNAGVTGYCLKNDDLSQIISCITKIYSGNLCVSNNISSELLEFLVHNTSATVTLTDREFEVLQLIVKGNSNIAIAENLGIALGTVKNHTSRIYRKIGVHKRSEAISWAWKNGIVE